jgi:hypothetical protein
MGYAADEDAYDVVEEGAVDEEFIGFHRWLGRSARVCEACLEAPSTGHADQVIKPYPKRSAGRRTVPCQAGWLAGTDHPRISGPVSPPSRNTSLRQHGRQTAAPDPVPCPSLAASIGASGNARHPHRYWRQHRAGRLDRRHRSKISQGIRDEQCQDLWMWFGVAVILTLILLGSRGPSGVNPSRW